MADAFSVFAVDSVLGVSAGTDKSHTNEMKLNNIKHGDGDGGDSAITNI